MIQRTRLFVQTISFLGLLLVAFQNCAPYEGVGEMASSGVAAPLSIEQRAEGILAQHCASCHGGNLNLGGVSHIDDVNQLIASGLITPGQPNSSRVVMAPEEGSMPPSYALSPADTAILRQWVMDMAAPPPVAVAPTCSVTVDKTNIQQGQVVVATLKVNGAATAALLNNQTVPLAGGSLTISLAATGTISGQVSNAQGSSSCSSPVVTVTVPPPAPNAPTCTLSSNQVGGIVPGDSIVLSLKIVGTATAATIDSKPVSLTNSTLMVSPISNMNYVATVTGAGKTNSCSLAVQTKTAASLTKTEFYRAKIGPNNNSTDDLLVRCSACHTQNPPAAYALAPKAFIFIPGDYAGNLAKFRAVLNPKVANPTPMDITVYPGLYQFASGHKPKNPPYTTAELNHIKAFVSRP